MRKVILCVLMMTLTLTACGGAGGGREAEELALSVRGEFLAAPSCAGTASVTADYGRRVYRYELTFTWSGEETVLALTAPDTVAGLTARLDGEENSQLEYDGTVLETGPLDDAGLTPLGAVPAVLDALRSGYLDTCTLEENETGRLLCLLSRDPEEEPGRGRETSLWIDPASRLPVRAEISQDGFRVILCEFSSFSKESPST